MKYIEYLSEGKYSLLGISHSVFIHNWKVLSYEMSYALWKWEYHLYDEDEWKKEIFQVTREEAIVGEFDITQYKWVEGSWICCFEALKHLADKHDIQMPTLKNRIIRLTYTSVAIFLVLLLSHIAAVIFGIAIHETVINRLYDVKYIVNDNI